jgi:hypothetical protein
MRGKYTQLDRDQFDESESVRESGSESDDEDSDISYSTVYVTVP